MKRDPFKAWINEFRGEVFCPTKKEIKARAPLSREARHERYLSNKFRRKLDIKDDEIEKYTELSELNKLSELNIFLKELKDKNISEKGIRQCQTAIKISLVSLKSKQCNEPYEMLLSDGLELVNIEEKHGYDAVDSLEVPAELYEFKPCSKSSNPSGTINDDSIKKIEKCESLDQEGLKGWLVLAGIDKDNFTFNTIYKFPLDIYNEDRRDYFHNLQKKNMMQAKQTRSTYGINIKKSIELCHKYNKIYYVWER